MPDHVFICYARDDQEFVLKLAANLKDRGVPVWLDQWDIPVGANWNRAIDRAIQECAQFLIVLSDVAVGSLEVEGEWLTALEEKKPILPVIHRECRLPRQLRVLQHVDFTSREPDDSVALERILRALGMAESAEPEISEVPLRPTPRRATPGKSKPVKPKPTEGKTALTNSIGMKFVQIPAGTFMMGSPPDEPERENGEEQHKVTITKSFYLQTTQVTQGQWKKVMRKNPSAFKDCGDECPVDRVSWDDVQNFIKRLNEREDTDKYRLPTEAEWEYACRAGTTTAFHTGDRISTDQANYDGNYPMPGSPEGEYRERPVKVGTFPPNAWGLYDMHGNVWEWCQDWYGDYPKGDVRDPEGPSTGEYRVLRGGSWDDYAWYARSAYRLRYYPGFRYDFIGFRVARDL